MTGVINFLIVVIIALSAGERTLRAVRNYDARLPCGQGKIFLDGADAYVLWVKDDEKFLYRFPNEDTLAKSLNPNNIYGTSCVDSEHCYDDTSLFLPKVGDQDAGKYRCRVHYQGSSSVDYVIDLQIVEATGTPKLYDEKGESIVTPYVGPLTLGSNLTIICEVVISDPPTTVLWLRNGVTVRRIVSDKPGLLRERIEIVNASRDELDAHYQCTASNADVTEAMAASVVVKMYLPPLKVEIRLNNNFDFEVGQPRVVDCVVVGCVPTPTINWYVGGKLLKASVHKELHDGNYTVSSLTLTASMRDNNKWLSCRVNNAYLPSIYEDNVTLHVGYRPTCNVEQARDIIIVPGQPNMIQCHVSSSEAPQQFRWTMADGRILYTTGYGILEHVDVYQTSISFVPTTDDVGIVQCHALNQFGEQRLPCLYNLILGEAPLVPNCREDEKAGLTTDCDGDENERHNAIQIANSSIELNKTIKEYDNHRTFMERVMNSIWGAAGICSFVIAAFAALSVWCHKWVRGNNRDDDQNTIETGLFRREPTIDREDQTPGSIVECDVIGCPKAGAQRSLRQMREGLMMNPVMAQFGSTTSSMTSKPPRAAHDGPSSELYPTTNGPSPRPPATKQSVMNPALTMATKITIPISGQDRNYYV